jgi:hypothetical protein
LIAATLNLPNELSALRVSFHLVASTIGQALDRAQLPDQPSL